MIDVKPCPLCGRKPEVVELDKRNYFIRCGSRYCVEQRHCYVSRAAAVKAWNRRKGDD